MSYSLNQDGFEIVPSIIAADEIEGLRRALSLLKIAPGHRNLMGRVPEVAALAVSPRILDLLEKYTGTRPFPVRSIFFDKTPEANWLVPWHQDLTIAVTQRLDLSDYGPWSVKDGVPHVQPPLEVLQSMVTIRIHLDDNDNTNGALRVIPRSHLSGKLTAAKIAERRSRNDEFSCHASSGDALVMRPLILHTSSAATIPKHRRVIHLEYATCQLPDGLDWAESR